MKRVLSFLLALCICLTIVPSGMFTTKTYASEVSARGGPGGGGDVDSGGNQGDLWFPSEPAVKGEDGNGTWIAQTETSIFLKSVAKAKTSNYYYNTIGWTIHKKDSGSYDDPAVAEKIQYVPLYTSNMASVTDNGSNQPHIISGSSSKLMFYNHDGEGKVVEDDRTTIPGKVIQFYKMDKTKFISTLMDKGYDFTEITPNMTHRFYLSGAARVTRNGGSSWTGPFTSKEAFKDGAGQALWDVVGGSYSMYFDVPLDIRINAYNTVSFYDAKTGKRLEFTNAGEGTHKYTVPETRTINGKVYRTISTTNYPWLMAPETSDSAYMETTYEYMIKNGTKPEDMHKHPTIARSRSLVSDKWTTDPGDSTYWSKTRSNGGKLEWNNTSTSNLFGNSTIVFCVEEGGDVVGYDNTTGKPILEETSSDGKFTFPQTVDTPTGAFQLVQTSNKENTTVTADKVTTEETVKKGGDVMGPDDNDVSTKPEVTVPEGGIGRGEYKPVAGVDVLYYDKATGTLINREVRAPQDSQTVKGSITYGGKTYKAVEVSYKLNRDPEVDIEQTKPPVMGSTDINVSAGTTVNLNPGDKDKQHIIRVSCEVGKPTTGTGGDYVIPSQHLTKDFSYKFEESFTEKVDESSVQVPEPYEHSYISGYTTCHHDDKDGHCTSSCHEEPEYSDCTVSYEIQWGDNLFDWNDNINSIVSNNLVFAGKGTLTKIKGDWHASGGSFDLSVSPSLDFTSHRKDVDGHVPTFAAYMESQNAAAKSFLKSNGMSNTVTTGLKPTTNYTDAGGDAPANVSVTPGSHTSPHGRKYKLIKRHSSCGADVTITEGVAAPSEYTNKTYEGTVYAEPSIVASPKQTAQKVSDVVGDPSTGKVTIYQSPSEPLKFYPTYKMFAGGKDAWLLGKLERNFMPVDVFDIEILNSGTPLEVKSTWSRDAQDKGRLVMKGGYNYSVNTKEPLKIKVTSYIHVPKANYVENGESIRSSRLQAHTNLVNNLSNASNYKIFSNLPEAYQDSYPAEWKIQNSYKKSGDNVAKSRMKNPVNIRSSVSNGGKTTITLSDIDSKFSGKTQSASRVKDQLETNSWYIEKFDGFEVIKQESTISISFDDTMQTNFIRNGGNNYNDLARAVHNIPSGKFGVTFGINQPGLQVNGNNVNVYMLTKPFLFDVRGSLYDDRNQ